MIELIGIPGAGKSYFHEHISRISYKDVCAPQKIKTRDQLRQLFVSRNLFIIILYCLINTARWRMKLTSLKWFLKFIFRKNSMFIEDEGFIQRLVGILVPETGSLNKLQKFLIKKLDLRSAKTNILIHAPVDIAFKRIENRKAILRFQGLNKIEILRILNGFDLVIKELQNNSSFKYQTVNNSLNNMVLFRDIEKILITSYD